MRRGTYYQRPVDGPRFGEVDADVGFPAERTTRQCPARRGTATQQAKAHLFRPLHTVAPPDPPARRLTRLRGHVIGGRGRGLAAARQVGPNDVMVASERRDHRAPLPRPGRGRKHAGARRGRRG
ncbi:hypothetical protein GCM10010390_76990 [Streptomyces mordarskii]|uniref:Uncharacterized protein n=1 Tax=Streptomyces mordarskii TaxID=1226758 RepID=A0ABP3PGQ0_9ACTN